jgi:glucose/arabinose dehydrogenase
MMNATRSLCLALALPLALASLSRAQHSWAGCEDVKPTDFRKVSFLDKTIYPGLNEPIKMAFAKDGKFYWIERGGAIKRWDPDARKAAVLYQLNVHLDNTRGGMGITLDPAFAANGFIYVVYMPNINPYGLFRLSRFTLSGDKLQDEKIVLDVPITVGAGQHASGAMAWDNDGNLFWGLGDNSIPGNYAEIASDASHDARRSSASSNNLNGKVLRIHPEANGIYTIPAGNLFPPGTAQTKPEIYAMGFRNPWTLWYDKKKGWLFEGEVGPDAMSADGNQGPAAQEEINLIKDPGFYGWPFLGGHNISYKVNGAIFDPAKINNDSPNNTGIKALPPARPALLAWGHDGKSQDQVKWPAMAGSDGTGMVGVMYRYDPALNSKVKLPPHFDGTLFLSDWEQKWVVAANVDDAGAAVTDVKKPFGTTTFYSPIGMTLGTDGALYVIEYGDIYFSSPSGQKISRIEYTGSCLPTDVSTALSPRRGGETLGSRPGLQVRLDQGRIVWVTQDGSAVSVFDSRGRR